jgi:L-threonylcarbamoyladenylate synthase
MANFETRVISAVRDSHPDLEAIQAAAESLQSGELVAFPTETVYGLGANALDCEAIAKIYEAKGRPSNNPLIVHICDRNMAQRIARRWPTLANDIADSFWPGPLTIVVEKADAVPANVVGGGHTVGLRMPAHPIALELIRAAGLPLAAPSANRSNAISPTTAEHVMASLGGRIPTILDGGPTTSGIESTVVDATGSSPVILRPGPISLEMLRVRFSNAHYRSEPLKSIVLPSPGMLAKHYSPRTPMRLVDRDQLKQPPSHVGMIAISPIERATNIVNLGSDPAAYAAGLYAAMHQLDAEGYGEILVESPPMDDAWAAIRDRLSRATSQ